MRGKRADAPWPVLVVLFAIVGAPSAANAERQPGDARELFDRGRARMATGDYDSACSDFDKSHTLDPGGGTVLNLAMCEEARGRTASAWVRFEEGMTLAKRDGRADRERLAREHLDALAGRLTRIRIVVSPAARVAGFVVFADAAQMDPADWDRGLAVDPGEHVVRAEAPGKVPVIVRVRAAPDSVVSTVTLNAMIDRAALEDTDRRGGPPSVGRVVGAGIAVLGLVSMVVGGYFGVRAMNRNNEADRLCPNQFRCDPAGIALSQDALDDARVATMGILLGAGAVAGGTYVFLTSAPPGDQSKTAFGASFGGQF